MTRAARPATTTLSLLLFFGWNGLFLCVMGFGFVPVVWLSLMQDALLGQVPLDFAIFSNLAVLIPLAATVLGLKLWRDPWRLLRLFYAVEAPLFMLCLYRLFGLHELTLGSSTLFGFIGLGALGQLHSLLREAPPPHGWRYLDLALRTLSLLAALYVGLLASFFVIPTLFVVLETAGRAVFWLLPMGLFAMSALVLCLWPVLSVAASARGYWSAVRLVLRSRSHGALRVGLVTAGVVAAVALGFANLPAQPQRVARDLLEGADLRSETDRARLLARREELRAGMVNAYLARHRYVADRSTDQGAVFSAYWHTVGLPRAWAEELQAAWNGLTAPLLYDGDLHADRAWAVAEYGSFFDEPIERAERAPILRALSATFRREDREAGLLDVDRRRVWLAEQHLELIEREGYAEVELHEIYENQTYDQEEVAYYFSLPESAVVTGLWLGESEDRAARHRFVVAPRGAAQAVYKAEVQRRVDPALLEQVGPRQYRLRAFPIPPRQSRLGKQVRPARMHLWLTYRTLPVDGVWPLPVLAEKRNVYFDRRTQRSMNGAAWSSESDWMPEGPAASRASALAASSLLLELGGGSAVRVRRAPALSGRSSLSGRSLVVVDRSYSVGARAAALAEAVRALEAAGPGTLGYWLAPTHGRPEGEAMSSLDVRELQFFGASRSKDLLASAGAALESGGYERVFVLTDEGTYEQESDRGERRDLGLPVYWVHLEGRMPRAYDDATIETLKRRGGGAVGSIAEALARLQEEREAAPGFVATADGFVFELVQGESRGEVSPAAALGARQLVAGAMRTGGAPDLGRLDAMHALAQRFEIVTPYSSMLVLVEERQRQALAAAEKADDRFEREVERGLEHGGPSVTGTPEPEEWALLLLGLGLALWTMRQRGGGALVPS